MRPQGPSIFRCSSRRLNGCIKNSHDFSRLFGGDCKLFTVWDRFRDVAVVRIPMAADSGDRCFVGAAVRLAYAQKSLVGGGFLGFIDIAAAEGVFLWVDAVLHETAVGAQDPPARTLEPADAARFNLKEHCVEFEDDAPMPPGIDAFPRCGRDPCAQLAARSQAKLERLVDQMGTPVVEDRTGRGHAAAPGFRWCIAADCAFKEQRTSEAARYEQVAHGQVVPIPAAVVEDRQQAAGPIAGLDHAIGIGRRQRHHLVDDAVAAGVERFHGKLGMSIVRRGDHHELDLGVGQSRFQVGVAAHAFSAFGYRLSTNLWIASDNPVQQEAGLTAHQGAMK